MFPMFNALVELVSISLWEVFHSLAGVSQPMLEWAPTTMDSKRKSRATTDSKRQSLQELILMFRVIGVRPGRDLAHRGNRDYMD